MARHQLESNARLVRWSDGSMHLFVGSDALTADVKSMRNDKAHLFVRHPQVRRTRDGLTDTQTQL